MYSFLGKIRGLFWIFFPPDTALELFFRSLYHKINATRIYTRFVIRKSEGSYPEFLKLQDEWLQNQEVVPGENPQVTFFLPIMPGQTETSSRTIQSICAQRTDQWRLVMLTESDNTADCKKLIPKDNQERVVVIHTSTISLESFTAYCLTEYFVCCVAGDQFSRFFLECFLKAYQVSPGSAVYYPDSDTKNEGDKRPLPHFKPGKYSPEMHLSTNYLSRSILSLNSAQEFLLEINPNTDFLVQEWELQLRICQENQSIIHIPRALVHLYREAEWSQSDVKELFERHLSRNGLETGRFSVKHGSPHIQWKTPQPMVSIIIPTKNQLQKLQKLLKSIFALTEYPNFEIILVDNGSTDPAVIPFYEEQVLAHPVRWIEYNEPFNYSKANNLGAAQANGELFLFINNDMEVQYPDWLSELSQWVLIPDIGVVGTKLIRPDRCLQHAGLVMGLQGYVGHLYLNTPEHYHGLLGSVDWYRNVSAVTGACQMFRRDVFEMAGGYDEGYQLVFSDVEICLRLLKKGYRILYNPHAALIHYEGASRGYKTPTKDILRGYDQMEEWIMNDDPYFSPNLTYTPIPACYFDPDHLDHRIAHIKTRLAAMTKSR